MIRLALLLVAFASTPAPAPSELIVSSVHDHVRHLDLELSADSLELVVTEEASYRRSSFALPLFTGRGLSESGEALQSELDRLPLDLRAALARDLESRQLPLSMRPLSRDVVSIAVDPAPERAPHPWTTPSGTELL